MIRSRTELPLPLPSLRSAVLPNPSAPRAAPRPALKVKLASSHPASVRSRESHRPHLVAKRYAGANACAPLLPGGPSDSPDGFKIVVARETTWRGDGQFRPRDLHLISL